MFSSRGFLELSGGVFFEISVHMLIARLSSLPERSTNHNVMTTDTAGCQCVGSKKSSSGSNEFSTHRRNPKLMLTA